MITRAWSRFRSTVALLCLTCMIVSAGLALGKITPEQARSLPAAAARQIDFANDIRPILLASCVKCHGRGRSKGDFRIDTRETLLKGGGSGLAVVVGNSEQSYLVELVSGLDPDNVMPKKGKKLTREEISLLRAWIDQGLPWDAAMSFGRSPPRNFAPR